MGWETHGYVSNSDSFQACANGEFIFAQKGGKDYFIKRFPKYVFPKPALVASGNEGILKRQQKCQAYYDRCETINKKVNDIAGEDGSLVICVDMFIEQNKIYKVYRKAEHVEIAQEDFPRKYDEKTADRLMRSLLTSVGTLHNARVVHSDIKYDNVFIVEEDGHIRCLLTDFDDSYLMSQIPDGSDIVGTPDYYSPEMGVYIENELKKDSPEAARLGTASDIFALGILYYVYLTGKYPEHSEKNCYLTLLNGKPLKLSKEIGRRRYNLISWMLEADPKKRPEKCSIIQQAIQNNSFEIPNYWPEDPKPAPKLTPKPAPAPVKRTEKAVFQVCGDTGECLENVHLVLYSSNGTEKKGEGRTNEKGIWGLQIPAGEYQIRLEPAPKGYEEKKFFLGMMDFGESGFAKRRLVLKKKPEKVYYLSVEVKDKYGIRVKVGKFRLLNEKKEIVEQAVFEDSEIVIRNLKEGSYLLQIQAAERSYKTRQIAFDTDAWDKKMVRVAAVLQRKEEFAEGEGVRVSPPVSGICEYRDLKNGFYELTFVDGNKKRVREQAAKMVLQI